MNRDEVRVGMRVYPTDNSRNLMPERVCIVESEPDDDGVQGSVLLSRADRRGGGTVRMFVSALVRAEEALTPHLIPMP